MNRISSAIVVLFVTAAFVPLQAQKDSLPDLSPLLSTLTAEQKTKVLDYAHYLGAYQGKPLEATCKLLDTQNQQRVAQYIAVLKNTGKPAPTAVHWNMETLQFAPIEEGAIVMDSFVVTNTGSAPYIIRESKTTCDCTVLSIPPFPVMPGDTAVVRIEFDSINKAGHAQPGIILYDNSRPNKRSILYLSGEITPKDKVKIIRN